MNLEIVGLRFKPAGKILQYVANGLALYRGEKCVAESENGLEIATVVLAPRTVDLQAEQHDLKSVLRRATLQDFEQAEALSQRAKEAFALCRSRIREVDLPMKLVSVDFTLMVKKPFFTLLRRIGSTSVALSDTSLGRYEYALRCARLAPVMRPKSSEGMACAGSRSAALRS